MIDDIIFLRKAVATNTTRNEKYTVYKFLGSPKQIDSEQTVLFN